MIYIQGHGYYSSKQVKNSVKFDHDRVNAKRYKTFNGIFKLYETLLLTYPDGMRMEYEIHKSKKVGRVLHEKVEYIGEYDLTEYYRKIKEEEEIRNHKVNIISSLKKEVETNLSIEDDFWK